MRYIQNTTKSSGSLFAFDARMTSQENPQLSSRKQPPQARSAELVTAILEAAVQVLSKEGAHRFTGRAWPRKPERALAPSSNISRTRAAILFRLQGDEWRQTTELLGRALQDTQRPPLERLRNLVHAFIQSECNEAAVRVALSDAVPLAAIETRSPCPNKSLISSMVRYCMSTSTSRRNSPSPSRTPGSCRIIRSPVKKSFF